MSSTTIFFFFFLLRGNQLGQVGHGPDRGGVDPHPLDLEVVEQLVGRELAELREAHARRVVDDDLGRAQGGVDRPEGRPERDVVPRVDGERLYLYCVLRRRCGGADLGGVFL